jgi:hypothetical protein
LVRMARQPGQSLRDFKARLGDPRGVVVEQLLARRGFEGDASLIAVKEWQVHGHAESRRIDVAGVAGARNAAS